MNDQSSRIAIDADVAAAQLTIVGVVDSHPAPLLSSAIESTRTDENLCLDLSGVEFIDSSGLRIIVNAHRAREAAGYRLELTRASEAVTRLLDITGLTDHLNIR